MSVAQTMRIAFLGDSIVNGTGDEEMLGWVGRVSSHAVARGHDVTCYNLGIRRDRSLEVAERWQDEVRRRLPAGHDGRVVFSFGVNDAIQMPTAPAEETIRALQSILMRSSERPMLFVGPSPLTQADLNQRIVRIDAAMSQICAVADVPYLSVFAALSASDVWMSALKQGDGAHPRSGGYRLLAELIEAWPAWRAWLP
jgi:acyl-CoA thioesterase-1